jgi:hypothetical protein
MVIIDIVCPFMLVMPVPCRLSETSTNDPTIEWLMWALGHVSMSNVVLKLVE